jgi:DNA-binding transcriptional LysR family regulator
MGQIEDLRHFVVVAETGGISKAAERLGIAKSAVSRRISLLEARYGAILIDRTPGVWGLTATGKELYQRARQVVGEMDGIEADFVNTSANHSGPLSVSVPREFGTSFLSNRLLAFKAKFPEIQLTVDFDDRSIDLDRENYDFAIRITGNIDESAGATRIGTVHHRLFAGSRYFETHPELTCLDDLRDHNLLYFGNARRTVWRFVDARGKQREMEFQPFLNSNNGTFLLQATIGGHGISRLPDFIASEAVARGDLVAVLPGLVMPEWGIYLVHSERRLLNRRMRLFSQMMTKSWLVG